ncbi:MAG: TSUP family transporter, partial [Halobacteriaceae archaeon]
MFEYWFMFPLGVFIGTIAMATGIGGASMFTPLFLTVLGLPASVAVGSGLLIEIFGFGAGLIGFIRKDLIDYEIGLFLLRFTIPAAIAGSILSFVIPDWTVLTAL